MGNKLVRQGLANRVARQFAAAQILDAGAAAEAFAEEALTAEERLAAHAELRRIAGALLAPNPEDHAG